MRVKRSLGESFTCGGESVAEFSNLVRQGLRRQVQLSEALSLLIVLSKRFEKFYREYVRLGDEDPDALLRIACLIAGLPPERHLDGITQLISAAAVDADKVDYVNRDACACGIPVGVDVSRVFLRSGLIRENRDQLIKARLKEDPAANEILFVINASRMGYS
jgi:deoxynucleoside triphosphate triphosphohydrolase SAMHD1